MRKKRHIINPVDIDLSSKPEPGAITIDLTGKDLTIEVLGSEVREVSLDRMEVQGSFTVNEKTVVKGKATGRAVCGAKPGRRSVGWTTWGSDQAVTCPRCLKKIKPIIPQEGDYVALIDGNGNLSGNFVSVDTVRGKPTLQKYWVIENPQGEAFAVIRYPEEDSSARRAWRETLTENYQ